MKDMITSQLSAAKASFNHATVTLKSLTPATTALAAAVPLAVMAATTPAAGDPGFELYDLFVNDLAKGPLGFVGAMALFLWAGSMIKDSYWKAGAAAIGGGVVLKADALTSSFGAMLFGY